MKRLITWLLLIALVLPFPAVASAESGYQVVYGDVIDELVLVPGNTFTYNVSIRDNPGIIIGQVKVRWPEADFSLKDVAFGFLPNATSGAIGENVGEYTVSMGNDVAEANYTDNGVLFSLTFELLDTASVGPKTISLDFGRDEADFLNFDLDTVPTRFESGYVNLVDVSANPQTVCGQNVGYVDLFTGNTFDYAVSIQNNKGIAIGQVKVDWPSDDFRLISKTDGILPDAGSETIGEGAAGTYTVSFGSDIATEDCMENGVLFTLTFKVVDTATTGPKEICLGYGRDEADFMNCDMNVVPTSFTNGSVELVNHYHSLSSVDMVEPTCEADGAEAHWVCDVCDAVFAEDGYTELSAPVVIPATGHSWGNWKQTTAATCEVEGELTRTCSVCGATEHNAIDPFGHDYSIITYEWAEDGSSATAIATCTHDASHKITETVMTTSEVVLEPTETEYGRTQYTALFENELFTTQTKVLNDIDPLGKPFKIGDTNRDGEIDARDRVLLSRYLAKWANTTLDLDAADIDQDGKVSAKDRVIFSRYLADWHGEYDLYFTE